MNAKEYTLVDVAKAWNAGRLSLEKAVNLALSLDFGQVKHELGPNMPFGNRARVGNRDNTYTAVLGLVSENFPAEKAHEFVSAVAAARADR